MGAMHPLGAAMTVIQLAADGVNVSLGEEPAKALAEHLFALERDKALLDFIAMHATFRHFGEETFLVEWWTSVKLKGDPNAAVLQAFRDAAAAAMSAEASEGDETNG